ncbi:MAG TPA: M12 family metallo-peptidase [Acidimicrobiales bacterium]|nr:M12 family metallo-peptidase [Acidimicrobiales bacterium]
MRSRIAGVVVALGLLSAGAQAQAGPPPDPPSSGRLPDPLDCALAADPQAVAAASSDTGQTVTLRTLVISDRVEIARSQEIMERVVAAYREVGLALDVTHRRMDLVGDDAVDLIRQTRHALAWDDVQGYDLVHVLSVAELKAGSGQVAGLAHCIGGIRYAKYHFATSVSRANMPEEGVIGPMPVTGDITVFTTRPAVTTAHEMAHSLGARHEHANCAENAPRAAADGNAAVCTVMDTNFQYRQLHFGTLERSTVRMFAIRYG